jgi:cell division protein FtsI (penicillin-binding protein 3)
MPVSPAHMTRFSRTRAAVVFVLLAGTFALLVGRVAYLQTVGRQQTLGRAERQQHQREVLRARRGSIYDRNGAELAGSIQTMAVFVDPKFMLEVAHEDPKGLAELDLNTVKLADLLGKDPLDLSQTLGQRFNDRFVKVAENVDEATCERVRRLNIPGVGTMPSDVRFYPMGSVAAHILGGAGHDGRGLEGIELRYEKTLAGQNGYIRSQKDAQHRPISVAAEDYVPAAHGRHLMLTIDANIQMAVEQELAASCQTFKAKRGECVVMDPRTGEILALANWPTFHPQSLEDTVGTPEVRRNSALVAPYEPGSTIKPFIAGPALAWHETSVGEEWKIPGIRWKTPYGRTITDVHAYGDLTTWDGLVKSSNILMSMLGERMGNAKLHKALTGFGFGRRTGIDLPGEDPGQVNALAKWTKYSTESVSQGYELMVTPVQLARAFCAYANGGRLVPATLVRGTLTPGGKTESKVDPQPLSAMPQVIDAKAAMDLRRVLADVPVRGTAAGSRSETWNVFGKTGTAHVSQGKGGYSSEKYTSSFIGGAPFENPRVVIAFVIHEPDKSTAHYGGKVAAPGAIRVVDKVLSYLQVPPSPELQPPPAAVADKLVHFDPKVYRQKQKDGVVTATAEDVHD